MEPTLDRATGTPRPEGATLELSRRAARDLDAAAQARYGIPGIVLMENAARGMADLARTMARPCDGPVVAVCGAGNNGGDGYAMARHLANHGFTVILVEVRPSRPGSDAAINAAICRRMGLAIVDAAPDLLASAGLVVDAVFGTGLDRPPGGTELEAMRSINRAAALGRPVFAVDLPSGIDNDRGEPLGEAVRATLTGVTVAPRPAMRLEPARGHFGRTAIVDIGSPAALLREFGTAVTLD